MKRLLWALVPTFLKKPWRELQTRIGDLEVAVDTLITTPSYTPSDATGFNGQVGRKKIFAEIIDAIRFDAILETGTWIGDTAGYMAETSHRPVYTVESNRRFYAIAKKRLSHLPGVNLDANDTCKWLRSLPSILPRVSKLFVYLDAHWYGPPPIKHEIRIICSQWSDFVIMIDDFRVPNDPGYGYDKYTAYGATNSLCFETVADLVSRSDLAAFFPVMASKDESGKRRGCIILASASLGQTLESLRSIRAYSRSAADS